MKNKNILLALLAFTVAIGSALASVSIPKSPWIKVRFWGSPNFVCVNTNLLCDEFGPVVCKVYVATMTGPMQVVGKEIGCTFPMQESSNLPVGLYFPPSGQIVEAE